MNAVPAHVVDALTMFSDGAVFAVRNDGTSALWEKGGPREVIRNADVTFAATNSAGTLLFSRDDRVYRRTSLTGDDIVVADGRYRAGAISLDGSVIALVASDGNPLEIRRDGSQVPELSITSERFDIRSVALSGDGSRVAAASGSYSDELGHRTQIEVWDTKTGGRVFATRIGGRTLHGVWRVVLSDDGGALAADTQTAGSGGVTVWQLPSGSPAIEVSGLDTYWVRGVSLSGDAGHVATGDESGHVNVWQVSDSTLVFEGRMDQVVNAVSLSPDASRIAIALWDSTIAVAATNAKTAAAASCGVLR